MEPAKQDASYEELFPELAASMKERESASSSLALSAVEQEAEFVMNEGAAAGWPQPSEYWQKLTNEMGKRQILRDAYNELPPEVAASVKQSRKAPKEEEDHEAMRATKKAIKRQIVEDAYKELPEDVAASVREARKKPKN
jgi:hypothetical protein